MKKYVIIILCLVFVRCNSSSSSFAASKEEKCFTQIPSNEPYVILFSSITTSSTRSRDSVIGSWKTDSLLLQELSKRRISFYRLFIDDKNLCEGNTIGEINKKALQRFSGSNVTPSFVIVNHKLDTNILINPTDLKEVFKHLD